MPVNVHEQGERAAWKRIYAPHNAHRRRRLTRRFRRLFRKGHKTSLRPTVRYWSRPKNQKFRRKFQYLRQIHPQAFRLIAQYGVDYIPVEFAGPLQHDHPPRQCFRNAWNMMQAWHELDERVKRHYEAPPQYVEGIVMGITTLPMLHGWNAFGIGSKNAFDFTCYAEAEWTRYIGVPFTPEEYEHLCGGSRVVSLFSRSTFPHVKHKLQTLLARRAKESTKRATA